MTYRYLPRSVRQWDCFPGVRHLERTLGISDTWNGHLELRPLGTSDTWNFGRLERPLGISDTRNIGHLELRTLGTTTWNLGHSEHRTLGISDTRNFHQRSHMELNQYMMSHGWQQNIFKYCKWEVGQYQPKVESLKTILKTMFKMLLRACRFAIL